VAGGRQDEEEEACYTEYRIGVNEQYKVLDHLKYRADLPLRACVRAA
jgi:hypothetical protein